MLRCLVFDGDDTLWETQALYDQAKHRLADLLSEAGHKREAVLRTLDAIDQENVRRLGYSRERFPLSMVETYRLLSTQRHHSIDHRIERLARECGESVFDTSPKLLDSAASILAHLGDTYRLVLCTKGDDDIQHQRLEQSGLRGYFSSIYVVPDKSAVLFARILSEQSMHPEESCSIGNSLKADINPALRLGMFAIWLQRNTWAYEHEEPELSDRLFTAAHLGDVPGLLDSVNDAFPGPADPPVQY